MVTGPTVVEVTEVKVIVRRSEHEARMGIVREARAEATRYVCATFGWIDARSEVTRTSVPVGDEDRRDADPAHVEIVVRKVG